MFGWLRGAECPSERHSFSGDVYSFHVNVLQLTMAAKGRVQWKIALVTEYWYFGDGIEPRSNRWIKLLSGTEQDVKKWVVARREERLAARGGRS